MKIRLFEIEQVLKLDFILVYWDILFKMWIRL